MVSLQKVGVNFHLTTTSKFPSRLLSKKKILLAAAVIFVKEGSMTNELVAPMRGKVAVVGRTRTSGVVLLDEPQSGHIYAVINSETKGVVGLMNAGGGGLLQDMKVSITEAECGSEGWRVLAVEPRPVDRAQRAQHRPVALQLALIQHPRAGFRVSTAGRKNLL